MKEMMLAAPVFLPLAGGGALLALSGRQREKDGPAVRIISGVFTLGVSLVIFWLLKNHMGGNLVLFRLFGNLTVRFKLDLMGGTFAGLIAFLWPLAVLYSFEYMKHESRKRMFFAYYVMTYGVTAGIALAGNLVTMYLCYEMLTLVTFPLVLFPMTKEAKRASRRYLYYSIGGAAFAFIGLVFVLSYSVTGNTEFMPGGILSPEASKARRNLLLLVYVLAFFGFGVKAALFPLHGWLPRAAVAPTPVTALLHAVAVVKSGAFAILRLTYFSYGASFLQGTWAQWVVMAGALLTIGYGSTMAVREIHWKRRLAYSTISNLSYILFGAALMSPLGLAAALSHLVIHAFMKICSFFCAGAVMHQTGKTQVYELDGLGRKMPVVFGCLFIASLSLMGIPLFGGFISKWNLAQAAFSCGSRTGGWLPYAGVGVILYSALMTGIYMMSVLVRAYFPVLTAGAEERQQTKGEGADRGLTGETGQEVSGSPKADNKKTAQKEYGDPGWMMLVPLVIFAGVIVLLGVRSAPLMELLKRIGGEAG